MCKGTIVSNAVAFVFLALAVSVTALAAPDPTPKPVCSSTPIDEIEKVDFYAYFQTEAQAIEAAAGIDERLFTIIVRTAADGPDWLLRATYRQVPDPETHAMQVQRLPALARSHGGRYPAFGCVSKPIRR